MAGNSNITSPIAAPPSTSRSLQATVEHADDIEPELYGPSYSVPSSMDSSAAPSKNASIAASDNGENEEEEIWRQVPLCRRDLAYEVAQSLWGVLPVKNFGTVMPGVYRSSFPKPENFSFLKTLGLKSILILVPGNEAHTKFITENGIQQFHVGIEPNKDPFVTVPQCNMSAALGVVLDRSNYPLLIHCNKGKHRTGTVVGCLRKIMGWDLAAIFLEYHRYADPKARKLDERFIELFDERAMLWLARLNFLVPAYEPINDSPISALSVSTRLRG